MSRTNLWAVTNQGKVFTLSTSGQQWDELIYCGMEFKRVSAVNWCAWGIGGDHQMYVYIFGLDVPIRVTEVAYENQRWNPKEGFCDRLLPSDRPAWSSEDGLEPRFREQIKLPTLSWQWEGDWKVEHNFDGQLCDPEGWIYAIDFPATYTNQKSWLSYVRRRKWTRLRRYISTNCWANVPSIHKDPVYEPFIDISIGGLDVPGGNEDALAVWAVTVFGRVMFRVGVCTACPEGDAWMAIPTPHGEEVNQLSVGATGLMWAVSWNGHALARLGVTRANIVGESWAEISPPSDTSKLSHVSVGVNAVWAITRDNKVWFRKGIRGSESGVSETWAVGSGWVEMVGEMSLLSVGPNDQVWALSSDERKLLYFRMAVTPQDLSGKTWKPIILPCQTRPENEDNFEKNATITSLKPGQVMSIGDVGRCPSLDDKNKSKATDDGDVRSELSIDNCFDTPSVFDEETSINIRYSLKMQQSDVGDYQSCPFVRSNTVEDLISCSTSSLDPGTPRLHRRHTQSLSSFHVCILHFI